MFWVGLQWTRALPGLALEGVELCPQQDMAMSPPGPGGVTSLGCSPGEVMLQQEGPHPRAPCPYKQGHLGHRQARSEGRRRGHAGRTPGRGLGRVATSQGAWGDQKLEGGGRLLPYRFQRAPGPAPLPPIWDSWMLTWGTPPVPLSWAAQCLRLCHSSPRTLIWAVSAEEWGWGEALRTCLCRAAGGLRTSACD